MTSAFERAFFGELRGCLAKFAAAAPASASPAPAPASKPPSPFAPAQSTAPGTMAAPKPPRPPGLSKAGGVASGLERLYLSLGPSAAGKQALRYATPRADAALMGRSAAKLLARGKPGFGDAVAAGRRSAEAARGALEKGGTEHGRPPAGDLVEAMGDIESLEHRVRHLAPRTERRAVHEAGRAIAKERTQALHKQASPFGAVLLQLAGGLVRR